MNSPIWLINTSITSYIYLLFVCFFLVRIIKYYCLPRFQLYNTVLPTIITVFYITFSDYIHLIGESFYFLTKLFLSPYPPATGNCFSTFCFKELNCKFFFFPLESTSQWYYALFVFLWLISFTIILQGPSIFSPHVKISF